MSNFNYMDRVPVKISESFKPPPRLYQLPQSIVHKLQLPAEHYNEAPQYCYDFQLEKKVLAKMPEWRRLKQQEREARRERKDQREQERLQELEARNKRMLGAVNYPSTDDLSGSDNETDYKQTNNVGREKNESDTEERLILPPQINSFHNILQPTIVSSTCENSKKLNGITANKMQTHAKAGKNCSGAKEVNAFNYKDFEEDTSSPFDNIELKTINDLDILAQVLHNTQLHVQNKEIEVKEEKLSHEEKMEKIQVEIKSELTTKDNTHKNIIGENNKVDFKKLNHQPWRNENIPNPMIANNSMTNATNCISNNSSTALHPYNSLINPAQHTQQKSYQTSYNTLYNGEEIAQKYLNFNAQTQNTSAILGNHNYLYTHNYNGSASVYGSPRHLLNHSADVNSTQCIGSNANNYVSPIYVSNESHLQNQQFLNTSDYIDSKSKSVPDILEELSDEVRNSEIRRSRYYSFNSEEEKQTEVKDFKEADITPKQSPVKVTHLSQETNHFDKLPLPAQRLVTNISSMGFPLERVAKISTIFGTDDKKIIEHLIPLSELMDLGFDEAKISEALFKFNNNKDKALEYLIS
ncbi:ubiquitin-associated protein 1 isoform X1 [Bactrocera dorsalis]|uniref:Ubiquitin-associated protein 1 isoform X1 n=1 Tax=Bactrocera dorsalis TaxID=27457 RepID=A0A6I9VK51_BACDO|nr:ubiquitin-associated protein 1 isoform X1 [Bactrocera dorsalis]